MKNLDYRQIIAQIRCKQDDRSPPDERRRGRFKAGWEDAALRRVVYTEKTLKVLTWQNLGYRFGEILGVASQYRIDEAYSYLANLYKTGHADMFVVAPSHSQYVEALESAVCSDFQRRMLRIHYEAPERTITATQMGKRLGYDNYGAANIHYGRLGRLVGEELEFNPWEERLGTLVTFKKRNKEWHWTLRPQVALALEFMGWVEPSEPLRIEEIAEQESFSEGTVRRVSSKAYERNPKARKLCISYFGTSCCVCGFNFGDVYGEAMRDYIHIHHLRPLSEVGAIHEIDPTEDLRPVCPNCHAVLHSRKPVYSIEEAKALLRSKGAH